MSEPAFTHKLQKMLRIPAIGGGCIEITFSMGLDGELVRRTGWYLWVSAAIQYRPAIDTTDTRLVTVHWTAQ